MHSYSGVISSNIFDLYIIKWQTAFGMNKNYPLFKARCAVDRPEVAQALDYLACLNTESAATYVGAGPLLPEVY
jgi:hypothetical protein